MRVPSQTAGSSNGTETTPGFRATGSGAGIAVVILESLNDALFALDPECRITYANAAAGQLCRRSREEILGRRWEEIFSGESGVRLGGQVERVLTGQEPVEFEAYCQLTQRWFHIRAYPMTGGGVSVQVQDITACKRSEQTLRDGETNRKRAEQQQQRLYTLVQAVNQAGALPEIYQAALEAIQQSLDADRASILFKDQNGVMRFKAWRGLSADYRRAVEGHSPWKPDEVNPQPVTIENAEVLEPPLKRVVEVEGIGALGFIPICYERALLGKFMVYYNQPHRFTENELRLAQTIASQVAFAVQRRIDEEELERLVRERTVKLEEMVRELQHVSYAITHDMRAPLRAMNAFASIVMQKTAGDPAVGTDVQEFCRRIVVSAARLDKLILDALDYTKAVLQELPLQPVDLAKLIPDLIDTYPNLQNHKADIRIAGSLPIVQGEESLLTQCFSNLLGNAVKFVPAGAHPDICIRATENGELVRISVEDNGIGIPERAQNRLFGMFQRLTADYEGTGIGLAIVRKVVERMGGKVGVESEVGKGARFWVDLRPATQNELPKAAANVAVAEGPL